MACLKNEFDSGVFLDGGRFETISPLNHGSFGMVFMAKDHATNEIVAIKCLIKQSSSEDPALDFAVDDKSEEAALHSRLGSHPNIVNLVHSFETSSHIMLVLEFCARGDLYEAIRNGQGPLETERVRQAMLELIDAVMFMHAMGISHRDIKPENIFLTQSGSLKLGDFGLATTDKWTYENTVGSDRYMSPEQYDSAGAGYSPAQADIWAIGICLLNILFSRNPFTTPTQADPLFLDFFKDQQALFDIFPSMSQDTYDVIVECMNLDPRKRSLVGARKALLRLISFTTLDDIFDEYCTADVKPGARFNREPLRTPSIENGNGGTNAFSWMKAVPFSHPRPMQRLPVIADHESYTEDLFPSSENKVGDWCSLSGQTPSVSSIMNSIGTSIKSVSIGRSLMSTPMPVKQVSRVAGSLPITMPKRRGMDTSLSVLTERKPTGSKSWSEMWNDENDDDEVHDTRQASSRSLQALKEHNGRSWSHESQDGGEDGYGHGCGLVDDVDVDVVKSIPGNVQADSEHTQFRSGDIDTDLVADGFFFHESPAHKYQASAIPRYSPPSRRGCVDKWAVLGERRRAFVGGYDSAHTHALPTRPGSDGLVFHEPHGSDRSHGSDGSDGSPSTRGSHGTYGSHGPEGVNGSHEPEGLQGGSRGTGVGSGPASTWANLSHNAKWSRDKTRERSQWIKTQDWNWRKVQRAGEIGNAEWVGGWPDGRS